ncbi:MAG: hypothetical protein CL802_16510 [Citromicrobium sp.]|nr:hypothetical protein WG75_08395 [Citromicrobium sp. WPS32]MAY77149.1 hypothetical protein [Citromicrobium sp.]MAY78755.1 hypothetical protein [Citromicrobium sp.]MAY79134.1 hypothetical protein [Citromicrobium sp.]
MFCYPKLAPELPDADDKCGVGDIDTIDRTLEIGRVYPRDRSGIDGSINKDFSAGFTGPTECECEALAPPATLSLDIPDEPQKVLSDVVVETFQALQRQSVGTQILRRTFAF